MAAWPSWPSSHGTLKPEKVGSVRRFRRGKPGIPSFTTGPRQGPPGRWDFSMAKKGPRLVLVGKFLWENPSIFCGCCLLPKIDQESTSKSYSGGKIQFIPANYTVV